MDTVSASEFKATCMAWLDRVYRTGKPLLITKRGKAIAQLVPSSPSARGGKWLGFGMGTGKILGDLVRPATEPDEWTALRR